MSCRKCGRAKVAELEDERSGSLGRWKGSGWSREHILDLGDVSLEQEQKEGTNLEVAVKEGLLQGMHCRDSLVESVSQESLLWRTTRLASQTSVKMLRISISFNRSLNRLFRRSMIPPPKSSDVNGRSSTFQIMARRTRAELHKNEHLVAAVG
jgi:hypothetical protein